MWFLMISWFSRFSPRSHRRRPGWREKAFIYQENCFRWCIRVTKASLWWRMSPEIRSSFHFIRGREKLGLGHFYPTKHPPLHKCLETTQFYYLKLLHGKFVQFWKLKWLCMILSKKCILDQKWEIVNICIFILKWVN